MIAPHLSVYSMIGLLVVAVGAGIGVRSREMMRRGGEAEFHPFETEPVSYTPSTEGLPASPIRPSVWTLPSMWWQQPLVAGGSLRLHVRA
ncbi:MAG: hypothetical protein U9N43_00110 [Euryarchaeota archaeon]|nr:hypothetical protein [Euryarchaeota archaeon]